MKNPPGSPIDLLQQLIRIPSVNPEGVTGVDRCGEEECARFVGEFLEHCGASIRFDEVLPGRPNVIGSFPGGNGDKFRLLFAPHTDTVSVAGMTIDPFGGEIRDGKVFGRGASDTKGTMAAMLWALFEMREELSHLSAEVSFTGLMGEEAGQPGSRDFAERYGDRYDFAVVGEPTECRTVYAHKGCFWIDLKTSGIASHGASPHLGENALLKLMPAVECVLDELKEQLPEFEDEVLGLPTVNLGKMSGGVSTNIVPDSASASLDIRETPELRHSGGALKLVTDILERNGFSDEIEIDVTVDSVPLLTDVNHPGVKALQSIGSELTTAPWFCDAGRLAEGGIPSVACGPGKIAQAHTKDEFLEIRDLEGGVEFYRSFLQNFRP